VAIARVACDHRVERELGLERVLDQVCAVEQHGVAIPAAGERAARPDDGVLAARDLDGHESRE
jgi:hypothetical protein